MIYLLPRNETYVFFYDIDAVPHRLKNELIEVPSLPEGEGILRRAEDGSFYYEPYPVVEEIPMPEPVEPVVPEKPVEKIDERLAHLEEQLSIQQQQNLILLDVNMTIYEELLTMQERMRNV